MDPRLLPFQIAAGLLLACFIIMVTRLGMNIYRNNAGLRSVSGALMFAFGLVLGWMTVLAGFGA